MPYAMPPTYTVLVPGPTSEQSRGGVVKKRGKTFIGLFTQEVLSFSPIASSTGKSSHQTGWKSGVPAWKQIIDRQ